MIIKNKIFICFSIVAFCAVLVISCSSTKYVPEGEYLLASTTIKSDVKKLSPMELEPYIKQRANFKTFELIKLPLFIYNLSGKDTTKWYNRALKSGGEPPVIYDSTQIAGTVNELQRIASNLGYLDASVDPKITQTKNKVKIRYDIISGKPYIIDSYGVNIPDSVFEEDVYSSSNFIPLRNRRNNQPGDFGINDFLKKNTLVKPKSMFDKNILEEERKRIASVFRNSGFYTFNKEYVGFVADTTMFSENKVELELTVYPRLEKEADQSIVEKPHQQYSIKHLYLYVDYDPLTDSDLDKYQASEIEEGEGYSILYGPRGKYIRPEIILDNCYIMPGALFNESLSNLTYNTLGQLKILRNVNIAYYQVDSLQLNCIITCVPDKKQGVSAEVEGTNSAGQFGVGGGLGYTHRNIFKGSEQFNIKLKANYEAITDFSKFDDNYFEIGGETSLTFPRFINPFLSRRLKRRFHASTQLAANYSYQRRPNFFTRTVLSGGIKYLWNNRRTNSIKHTLDLIEVSYVHLPFVDNNFLDDLTPEARLYSFQDQFILGAGYTYYNSNYDPLNNRAPVITTIRASVESAGNVLALIAYAADIKEDEDGSKKIFNTTFSQYIKGNIDFSKAYRLDDRNSIAWRIGGGIAYPYGNNKLIPIQKRFFSGGANSVRGWGIRELGPGAYYNSNSNFYFHSGDIRFDANIEYRSKVFWILELAAFLDAGNIWTIKEYEGQENGQFKFDKFYKEIAAAWGLGIRFDFDFVLIRLDCGWKMYDPANNPDKSHWPVIRPWKIKDNTAWHIAVGYPF